MTLMTTSIPERRRISRAEWDALPEHKRKTELLDGELVEMAVPKMIHQDLVSGLNELLRRAAPPGIKVRFAPVAVQISELTIVEPDLVAGPKELFLERGLVEPPLLVVEVLSPSTRRRDVIRKFRWFEQFGIQHVWFADPDEPSVAAWELIDGHYVEAGEAVGDQTLVLERPFRLEVNPQRLLETD